MSQYYIDNSGSKDGPYDLVTIMRRIRAEKITPTTGIYLANSAIPMPAGELQDTALFFEHNIKNSTEKTKKHPPIPALFLKNLLFEGWNFTANNSIVTIFSGGITLLCILSILALISLLGVVVGLMTSFIMCTLCQYIFAICILRMYRGQPFSNIFWNKELPAIIPNLLLSAVVIGLMMIGGLMLFVLPCLIISVWYAFVPFLMVDRKMSLIEAMTASRLLLKKHRYRYQWNIGVLMATHLCCLILIIPSPITLPIFATALARFYEELSSS